MRSATHPLRVLVVDDDRDNTDSLVEVFELAGHSATPAYDGPAALAAAEKSPPDVVVLDLAMPTLGGHEVARRLRRLPGMAEALLVCLTGFDQPQYKRQALEAGCDCVFVKPAELDDLLALLRT